MLAIPSPRLGRNTYIDENALQPGQVRLVNIPHATFGILTCFEVSTRWNWNDVHRADQYLEQLEAGRDRNGTTAE